MSGRHGVGLASIVLFPVVGALRLAGVVDAVPYAFVAGAAVLFLAYSLAPPRERPDPPERVDGLDGLEPPEPLERRDPSRAPRPQPSPLLH